MMPIQDKAATGRVWHVAAVGIAGALAALLATGVASSQSLTVLPVNIQMTPGQRATTLTVTNKGDSETAVQVRAYAWSQQDGDDQLTNSDAVLVSPPLASIAAGGSQVIRLVLRQSPQGREATYRLILDQIPPPVQPGVVRVVLRISIPIFAQPPTRVAAHVQFHMEREAGHDFLVALNDGGHHEAIRDMVLSTADGRKLSTGPSTLPYILAGAARRWPITAKDALPLTDDTLRLTAREDSGAIEQQVHVVRIP